VCAPSSHGRHLLVEAIPYLIFVATVAYFLSASTYSVFDFPLDDAWIHRVYAESFANGRGFEYNPGVQEAGATSPLWVVVSAPAHWLDSYGPRAVVVGVKALGMFLGLLTIAVVGRMARGVTGSTTIGTAAAALFALEPRLTFSALSGMENTLLVLLWLFTAAACVERRWLLSASFLALTPVCRPEALLLFPVWLIGFVFLERVERPPLARLGWMLLTLVPLGVWMIFCYAVNGHPLPNTFYVKSRSFSLGLRDLLVALAVFMHYGQSVFFVVPGLVAAVMLLKARPRGHSRLGSTFMLLGVGPLLYTVAVAGSRALASGGYYWERWIDPASLVFTAGLCISVCAVLVPGVAQARRAGKLGLSSLTRSQAGAVTGSVVVTAILVATCPSLWHSLEDSRSSLSSDSRAIRLINVRAGQWLAAHTPKDARVGVNDAGGIRYFGRRWTVDLVGLNSTPVVLGRRMGPDDIDWLAVFPTVFRGNALLRSFESRAVFEIPEDEYTVCPCPGQNHLEIMERKKAQQPVISSPSGMENPRSIR
jgi:hypothetical protein